MRQEDLAGTILGGARVLGRLASALAILLMEALVAACRDDSGAGVGAEHKRAKVVSAPRTYTVEDLKAVGLKTNKHYDVEGL